MSLKGIFAREAFPKAFCWVMIFGAAVSLWVDLYRNETNFLFQRAGALLTLAGVNLQYAKLLELWAVTLQGQIPPTVDVRIKSGQGISLGDTARQAETAHSLARSLHGLVTGKSSKDVAATMFIVCGTLIWAYGDIFTVHLQKVVRGHF